MGKCELCGQEGSRLEINHEEKGRIMVCRDCWTEVKNSGRRIMDTSSSSDSGSSGMGCPYC